MSCDKDMGEDLGAQFRFSPDLHVPMRKRANTFPSTLNIDLNRSLLYSFDESEHEYDTPLDSPPLTPNKNLESSLSKNNQVFKSNDYRNISVSSNAPNTPLTTRTYDTHIDTYTSVTNQSLMPSVTSPISSMISPISLFGSPHMPTVRYFGYSPMYSPLYSGHFGAHDYHTNLYNNTDRITDMARQHRNAASHAEARHTWSGTLPNSGSHKPPIYSSKVFLGGVPWEMTDHDIKLTFSRYGNVQIMRPGQHVKLSRNSQNKDKAGYLYLIFDSDKQVKSLINACTHDFSNGGKYYFALNQMRFRPKDVQIIPWNTNDTTYVKVPSARIDANKTVFVGALHGMLTAEGLACILEDLFGSVVYVGIDTDKYKYPIGSARVTFSTTKAYSKAVHAAFIDVKSNRFQKKLQIDPFLEETNCSHCRQEKGPIFCRDVCMAYFCRNCWEIFHSTDAMRAHQPIMRNKAKF